MGKTKGEKSPRKLAMDRLEEQRALLVTSLELAAKGLLRGAAKRLPEAASEPLVEVGSRTLSNSASKLRERSVQDLVEAAQEQLKSRPALSAVALFGAGILAGRLVRLEGGLGQLASR